MKHEYKERKRSKNKIKYKAFLRTERDLKTQRTKSATRSLPHHHKAKERNYCQLK